jgi:SAM-dependent methyltransferase
VSNGKSGKQEMNVEYDKYYQTENLFGEPYPELIKFYSEILVKGKLLDLGCGQGRDSIALAKLGFDVTGIDNSKVGIDQLNRIAKSENLPLIGIVADIYSYSKFDEFDFILLDSMFHFGKRKRNKETDFLIRVIKDAKPNALITICIQKTGKKLEILNDIIFNMSELIKVNQTELIYRFEDKESNHNSETKYEMITVKKMKY